MQTRRAIAVSVILFSASVLSAQTAPSYAITNVAGASNIGDGGSALKAYLWFPTAIAYDSTGVLYLCDSSNGRVRRVTGGIINTFSNLPCNVMVLDKPTGNLYVAALGIVYRIDKTGAATRVAGSSFGDSGDGAAATSAQFSYINGLALRPDGTIYIADTGANRVRKITPDGKVRAVAGTGVYGYSGDNGQASIALLNYPQGLAVDAAKNVYVSDSFNNRIRKIGADGTITTFAGTGDYPAVTAAGVARNVALGRPAGLAFDSAGTLFATTDTQVVSISADGNLKVVAGSGTFGFAGDGSAATAAALAVPANLAFDASKNLVIADTGNHRIRTIVNGSISTLVGQQQFAGDGGPATAAVLFYPAGVARTPPGVIYLSETYNHRIRKIDTNGIISTIAGSGSPAASGDGGRAISAGIPYPSDLALDSKGNLYVLQGNQVRRITPDGAIQAVAGSGQFGDGGDNGPATKAQFGLTLSIAIDSTDSLYIGDGTFCRIRKVRADGVIISYAGNGKCSFGGDGGLASAASINNLTGLAFDKADSLYFSDGDNCRLRKVTKGGIITTVAGTGVFGLPLDGARVDASPFSPASSLFIDSSSNIFMASASYSIMARIGSDGRFNTIAGSRTTDGYAGDGGAAISALLSHGALGLTGAPDGSDLLFADAYNHRVRRLTINSPATIDLVRGDKQTGPAGSTLDIPLVVKVSGSTGIGIGGVAVNFAVASGTATLSASTTTTDTGGLAGVGVTLGSTSGPIVVTASVAGLAAITFNLTISAGTTVAVLPKLDKVVSGGLSAPPLTRFAPLSLAVAFGSGFASTNVSTVAGPTDYVDGRAPLQFAGVCVEAGGIRSPVLSVSSSQILFQSPVLRTGSAPVQVITNCGTPVEYRPDAVTVSIAAASPEFFYAAQTPDGKYPVAAVNASDGSLIGPPDLVNGAIPAKPGDTITMAATGFGLTDPVFSPGEIPSAPAVATGQAVVKLGDLTLPDAAVIYVGVQVGYAGANALTLTIPPDLPDGDYPVTLTLGGFTSPANGYLTVQSQ